MKRKDAVERFYKPPQFKNKRDLADTAVKTFFSNPHAIEIWNEIISEIDMVSDVKGARNILSHNPLSWDIYKNNGDVGAPFLFELAVSRNSNEAAAHKRPERKENNNSVRQEACALHKAYMRLFHFYDTYLKTRYKKEE